MINKVKLISTLGPSCDKKEILSNLVKNGLCIARFNFSHANYEGSERILQIIKEINQENNSYVGTMLDTKGPEIRTHNFDGAVQIEKDSEIIICFNEVLGTKDKFSLTYDLYDDIKEGNFIFIDDGYLTLEVIKKDSQKRELVVKANNTHVVKSRRGVNVPNIRLQMPYISEKDKNDILFACKHKYDFLALSFVRRKEDLFDVKKLLNSKKGYNVKIISKIENQEGLDNLDDIIEFSDGIMIARGDLGIEIDSELVPSYQTNIIQSCLHAGKPVIVATQMLESMQKNPRPTKAETSDVYNAVLEGATATMLSGESASGLYPEKAVMTMAKIQKEAEKNVNYDFISQFYNSEEPEDFLVFGAIQISLQYPVSAIVVDDKKYAISLSKFHPIVPVFVKANNISEATSLSLNYANIPFLNEQELKNKLELLQKESDDKKVILEIKQDSLKIILEE